MEHCKHQTVTIKCYKLGRGVLFNCVTSLLLCTRLMAVLLNIARTVRSEVRNESPKQNYLISLNRNFLDILYRKDSEFVSSVGKQQRARISHFSLLAPSVLTDDGRSSTSISLWWRKLRLDASRSSIRTQRGAGGRGMSVGCDMFDGVSISPVFGRGALGQLDDVAGTSGTFRVDVDTFDTVDVDDASSGAKCWPDLCERYTYKAYPLTVNFVLI